MKKIEYQAPAMEIIKMKFQQALLDGSVGGNAGGSGSFDPGTMDPNE
jgi:hypothetical protein